jgi:dimethylglycine dehydrogenase
MICGRLQRRAGRVGLAYLLNDHGMVKAEATIANIPASDRGPDRIWYGSAAAAELHDMDWLQAHIGDDDVQVKSLTNDQTILVLAGPKAREILAKVSRADWSKPAFPWLSVRECFIGFAPATVMSVSFSGELAYEIHVPNASLYAVYLALRKAGVDHLFGASAIESMRMEKGYLHWKADLITEFDPFETGVDRFVHMDKGDFVGKAALTKRMAEGSRKKRVSLVLDSTDAPAHGGASVMQNGRVVGTVTSGDWGHRVGLNLAYAFVDVDLNGPLHIDVLGKMVPARIISDGPYDPDNKIVRS